MKSLCKLLYIWSFQVFTVTPGMLMLVKSMAKAVNGLITPHTERCGIKAIQRDLVLSRVINNVHTATALLIATLKSLRHLFLLPR